MIFSYYFSIIREESYGKEKRIKKKKKNVENISFKEQVQKDIQDFILMDDEFFNICFKNNTKAVTRILRVILKDENLEIIDLKIQEKFSNLKGHSVYLDIIARNKITNTIYNIEIQNTKWKKSGASPERARYHVDIYDTHNLKKNQDFKNLPTTFVIFITETPTTFVIFITETDVFGEGLPIYKIQRYFEHNHKPFNDRSHIIYVNGAYEGNDDIGKLVHDFKCKNPDEFYFEDLAEKVKFLKNTEEGNMELSPTLKKTADKYIKQNKNKYIAKGKKDGIAEGEKLGIEKGEKLGIEKGEKLGIAKALLETAKRMIKKGVYSLEEIAENLNLPLSEVQTISTQMA